MRNKKWKWARRSVMIIWGLLILLALPPLTLTGCYTTKYVQRLGVTKEAVESIESIRYSPDGQLAIGVETVLFREGWGVWYPRTRILGQRHRWMVAQPDQVQGFLASYPALWGYSDPWMIVGPFELTSLSKPEHWTLHPDDWSKHDGANPKLPIPVAATTSKPLVPWAHPYEKATTPTLASSALVLNIKKGDGYVNLAIENSALWSDINPWYWEAPSFRERREWWGYPLQILILPAVVIDVITSPIQAYAVKPSF